MTYSKIYHTIYLEKNVPSQKCIMQKMSHTMYHHKIVSYNVSWPDKLFHNFTKMYHGSAKTYLETFNYYKICVFAFIQCKMIFCRISWRNFEIFLQLSHTLSFVLYYLSLHPSAQEQIYNEISEFGSVLTHDDLNKAVYTKACIQVIWNFLLEAWHYTNCLVLFQLFRRHSEFVRQLFVLQGSLRRISHYQDTKFLQGWDEKLESPQKLVTNLYIPSLDGCALSNNVGLQKQRELLKPWWLHPKTLVGSKSGDRKQHSAAIW